AHLGSERYCSNVGGRYEERYQYHDYGCSQRKDNGCAPPLKENVQELEDADLIVECGLADRWSNSHEPVRPPPLFSNAIKKSLGTRHQTSRIPPSIRVEGA